MSTKCFAQARGSVIRVTALDSCGNPDPGASAVVVSKRVSSITLDEVTEEGTNIREKNFADELLVVDDAMPSLLGFSADTNLCGVDPDIIPLFTKQPVVRDANDDVVGFDVNTGIDLDSFGFALEVWSRIAGSQCDPSGHRLWGYTPFPFFKGGRIGGFSFENGLVQFKIVGSRTYDGNGWGVGPYDVTRDENGDPAPMHTPLGENTAFRNIVVNLDPPAASCGAFALASI